jgi:hypothetical protein
VDEDVEVAEASRGVAVGAGCSVSVDADVAAWVLVDDEGG